jgi:hypothetical protein
MNNNKLIDENEIEKEKENILENEDNKLNNKSISDNSDCETIDEDKKNKSSENEKKEKEIIHSNIIDKPIQKFEIHINSNIINLNQKGCIEMYPEALFFAMDK